MSKPMPLSVYLDTYSNETSAEVFKIVRMARTLEARIAELEGVGNAVLWQRVTVQTGFYDLWKEAGEDVDRELEKAFPGKLKEIKDAAVRARLRSAEHGGD